MTCALREAAQAALTALEESVDLVRNDYATDWRHGLPSRKAQLDGMAECVKEHEDAITALRAALAAPPVAPDVRYAMRETLTTAIQLLNGSTYNLTKAECVYMLTELRDSFGAAPGAPDAPQSNPQR